MRKGQKKDVRKRFIHQTKKKVKEEFGRKMNEELNGNSKLFSKEENNVKKGKMDSCGRIRDGNGRLVQGEDEV